MMLTVLGDGRPGVQRWGKYGEAAVRTTAIPVQGAAASLSIPSGAGHGLRFEVRAGASANLKTRVKWTRVWMTMENIIKNP